MEKMSTSAGVGSRKNSSKVRSSTSSVACSSAKAGDFNFKACAPFCKELSQSSHCTYCKCSACSFCEGHKKQPAVESIASSQSLSQTPSGSRVGTSKTKKPLAASAPSTKIAPAPLVVASEGQSSADLGTAKLYAALRAAEAKARQLESRLATSEKQLSLCRHSAAGLRTGTDVHTTPPLPPLGSSFSWRRDGMSRANATAAIVCTEAVEWAMRLGAKQGLWPPGLNASSSRAEVQLHLALHDPPSRCSGNGGEFNPLSGAVSDETDDEEALSRREAFASVLLMLGVLACGLCNAWALGYLQPDRRVRAALQYVGIPTARIVR